MEKETVLLENLIPNQAPVLAKELTSDLPVQDIEVVHTIKKVGRTDKKDWQGYLIKFVDSGVTVVVDASHLLAAGDEAFEIEVIKDKKNKPTGDKTFQLVATQLGYELATRKYILA